jgi:hypothetical protein
MIVLEDKKASDYKCGRCGCTYKDVFIDAVREGKILYEFPQPVSIRERVLSQFKFLEI